MGTSRSSAQLAGKIDSYALAIPRANRHAVERSALVVKTTVLGLARPATGGDLKFSGGGGKVGVRYDVKGLLGNPTALIRATGNMHWLESGVKRHGIAPKALGGSRRSRVSAVESIGRGARVSFGKRAVLKMGDDKYAAYARNAGGFPAKKVWSGGIRLSDQKVRTVFRTEHRKALGSVFGL